MDQLVLLPLYRYNILTVFQSRHPNPKALFI